MADEVESKALDKTTDDTSLEDMDLSFDDLEDDGTDESEEQSTETEEESDTEESEDEDTQEESSEEEQETEETEEQSDETEESEEKPDVKSADEQKRLNNEAAQKRIAERAKKEELRRIAEDKYLEQAEDDKDLALRQLQLDAYNNKIERNSDRLKTGIDRALADIDLFREGSPEIKDYLISKVDDFEKQYVTYSSTGDPVEVKADVYEYLQKEADTIRRLVDVGVRKNAGDKQKVKAKTLPRPSKTPKETAVDPDLAAFDEEVEKYR